MNVLRRYMSIVEGVTPAFLYHVTSDVRLPSITRQGLVPQVCRDADEYGPPRTAIYLGNWRDCVEHGEVVHDRLGGDLVYFRIAVTDLDPTALQPDDYDIQMFMPGGDLADPRLAAYTDWRQVPWQLSLEVCGVCAYTKIIPFSAIARVVPR